MVAQPMPARQNMAFMSIVGLSALRKAATPNSTASITTPPRMVFLRPILDATMPTGRYATMAAACASMSVRL